VHMAAQLLAYHVAVLKGTDVDQPRNLAKSLTVERQPTWCPCVPVEPPTACARST